MTSKKKLLTAAALGSVLGLAGPVAGHATGIGKSSALTSAATLGSMAAKKKAAKKPAGKKPKRSSNTNKNATSGNKNKH